MPAGLEGVDRGPAVGHADVRAKTHLPRREPQNRRRPLRRQDDRLEKLADEPLEEYAAVWLLDPTPLPPAVWDKLRDYVTYGGGLAIWLGATPAGNRAIQQPSRPGSPAAASWPGRRARATACSSRPRICEHPVLRGFRSKASQIPGRHFQSIKYWQLEELKDGVNVIIPVHQRPARHSSSIRWVADAC